MRREGSNCTFLILLAFLFGTAGSLSAGDFYLLPEVIGSSDTVTIGSFVTNIGSMDEATRKALASGLDLPIRYPAIISSEVIKNRLAEVLTKPFVVVGKSCIYVPASYADTGKNAVEEWQNLLLRVNDINDVTTGWLEIRADKNDFRSISPVEIPVTRFVPALKSGTFVPGGERIAAENFSRIYIELNTDNPPLGELPDGDNFVAAKNLVPGAVLGHSDIKKKQIVRAGDRVTIVVKRYPIFMKLEGIAYGSGGKGDTIKVKPVRADRSLYGNIVAAGEVSLDEM